MQWSWRRDYLCPERFNFHNMKRNCHRWHCREFQIIVSLTFTTGLNSKPFRSMYVEKAYSTVDSDSSVGWGRYAWRPPWCFSIRAGYEPAPGFTFSLPFVIIIIIIQHNNTTETVTLTVTLTSTFSRTLIQILISHVKWSAQAVRDSKIDHT